LVEVILQGCYGSVALFGKHDEGKAFPASILQKPPNAAGKFSVACAFANLAQIDDVLPPKKSPSNSRTAFFAAASFAPMNSAWDLSGRNQIAYTAFRRRQ
jgi:hypothetical protein